jgi:hypothetical protein
MIASRWRFILLMLAVYAADVGLTLAGQAADYWAGDYSLANEGNPLARPFLAGSPWLFLAGAVVWGTVLAAVVLLWRHRAGEWLAVLCTLGHAFGGACWLALYGAVGWVFVLLYLVAVTMGLRWCRTCPRSPPASCRPADSSRRGPP